MRGLGIVLGVLGLIPIGSPAPASDDASGPRPVFGPPLEIPLSITGTFGEPRANHLHTGLDLSTGGRIGLPVLAIESGWVVRLLAGAGGYGRAVYLETERGELVVYGHLSRFAPPLETYLRGEQRRKGEFEINLYPDPGRFRFSRGDTLAFSGASGAGPPHLHLELRRGNRPQNPLLLGVAADDEAAPSFEAVRLHALGPLGHVNRAADWLWRASEHGEQPEAPVIPVWGWVGVEAAILDRCGFNDARLAPLEVTVSLDGILLFRRRFSELSFDRGREVRRIYGRDVPDLGVWMQRLFQWPLEGGADQAQDPSLAGWIDASTWHGEERTLSVSAVDASGGRVLWRARLLSEPAPMIADWAAREIRPGRWQVAVRLAAPADSSGLVVRCQQTPGSGPRPGPASAESDNPDVLLGPIAKSPSPGWELPRGERWFGGEITAPDGAMITLRDGRGLAVCPPIRLGAAALRTRWRIPREGVRTQEGFLTLDLVADPPPADLPEAHLLLEDGGMVPMILRPGAPQGAWRFAALFLGQSGQAREIVVEAGGKRRSRIPIGEMILLPGLETSARIRVQGQGPGHAAAAARLKLDAHPADGLLTCKWTFPGDSLWTALCCELEAQGGTHRRGELELLTPILVLEPSWWPLMRPLEILFERAGQPPGRDSTEPGDGWGLYRCDSGGRWRYEGAVSDAGGWGGRADRLGCFAILRDGLAPEARDPEPAEGRRLDRAPTELRARIRETGSGFDPQQADIILDGRSLITEFDVDQEILIARPDDPLGPGDHSWEVHIRDRAGNMSIQGFTFTVGR